MPAPTISVVIPAYNAESFIGEALRSVLDQDESPAEIIVVDDGCTDATADIVAGFGPRVTLLRQANGGEASARNAGMTVASGEWVSFLDADDRFLPSRMRAVRTAIERGDGVDAVTTDAFLESAGAVLRRCYEADWPFAVDNQREEILRRNFVFGHVTANRRRLLDLGGFDESIRHTSDWAMWIRLLLDDGRIGAVLEPLSVYRLHAASMSADRVAIERGSIASLESALDNPALRPHERPIVEATIANHRLVLDRATLSAALSARSNSTRSVAATVARNRNQPGGVRVRAALATIAPEVASRMLRRRRRGFVVGTTGRLVPSSHREGDG